MEAEQPKPIKGTKNILVLVLLALLFSGGMVWASLWLYRVSGASQLDLSRPGYEREKPEDSNGVQAEEEFSNSGEINKEAVEKFRQMLEEKIKTAEQLDMFGSEALSDKTLGID